MKTRLPAALFLQLILVQHAALRDTGVMVSCNRDVSLPCPGMEDGLDFIAVTWYKVGKERNFGIIRISRGETEAKRYNFSRPTAFGDRYSLRLDKVTPRDAGLYECEISANIGGRNRNFKVDFTVGECQSLPETTVLNSTVTSPPCIPQAAQVPLTWSAGGYVAVALFKVALSLSIVWVIHWRTSGAKPKRWCS